MKASQKTGLIRQVWYWPRGVGATDRRMVWFHSSIPPVPQTMVCSVALPSGSISPFMSMNAKEVIMHIEPGYVRYCFDLRPA